jgi:ligand-binding SRPBCC domain-containing protein
MVRGASSAATVSMCFVKESVLAATVEELFAFHERPDCFEMLQPPWERSEIIQPPASLAVGTEVKLRTRVGPFWVAITARHIAYDPPHSFEDEMIEGPFAKWHHKHLFLPHEVGCCLRDEVDYEPPFGVLGRLANPFAVRPRLVRLFDYRHEVTRAALAGRRWRGAASRLLR